MSLGRYSDAFAAVELAAYEMEIPNGTGWALPELIDAAVRTVVAGARSGSLVRSSGRRGTVRALPGAPDAPRSTRHRSSRLASSVKNRK